jgi:hypothetical protein
MNPNPTINRSGIAYHDAGTGSGEVDRRKRFIRSIPIQIGLGGGRDLIVDGIPSLMLLFYLAVELAVGTGGP